MKIFTVAFEVEVRAETPQQAATIARDTLLDPDGNVTANIYPHELCSDDDYHPTSDHGWFVYFRDGKVRPDECIAWETYNRGGKDAKTDGE